MQAEYIMDISSYSAAEPTGGIPKRSFLKD
jgi:hypothetical protein